MTTLSGPSPVPPQPVGNPLADCLAALAGTPDDSSWLQCQLVAIAQLAAGPGTVSAASVTAAYGDDVYVTVAASDDSALAADEVQYADGTGPAFAALHPGSPIAVPDIRAATRWPAYGDAAARLGIRASLSIPLFAGRGTAIAALNLYGHDPQAMAQLTAAVWNAYDPDGPAAGAQVGALDPDGTALVTGLTVAFAVRAIIQQAMGILMASTHRTPDTAYLHLRLRAAEAGATLPDTAAAVIAEHQR